MANSSMNSLKGGRPARMARTRPPEDANGESSLDVKVAELRKTVTTDTMSMSIGEIAGIYKDGELDLQPKFQRILRWEALQKSRLIESILLGIPVPPIYVGQDPKGKWTVVDGMQRLGTIFEFMGILKDRDGNAKSPLQLEGTHLLPELDGMSFREGAGASFSVPLQLDFRRARLDVKIILRGSDPATMYELFERLNTGGSLLSDQEVRNCILVWANEPLFDWFQDQICANKHFESCMSLSDRKSERQYQMELALRFFVFYRMDVPSLRKIDDLQDFLNEHNRELATSRTFDLVEERKTFNDTFRILDQTLGANAFRRPSETPGRFTGPFLISAFEAVAMGIAYNIDKWRKRADPGERIEKLIRSMWKTPAFTKHIGPGVPARDRVRYSVPFGRTHFVP